MNKGALRGQHGAGAAYLVGYTEYNPASNTSYNTASTTLVDVDATNFAVTFVAPPSGAVVVCLSAVINGGNNGDFIWGLRDSVGPIANSEEYVSFDQATTVYVRLTYRRRLTGLVPGTSYTWKWAFRCATAATAGFQVGGSTKNPVGVMEVWAA